MAKLQWHTYQPVSLKQATSALQRKRMFLAIVGWRFTSTLPTFASTLYVPTMTLVVHRYKPLCSTHQRRAVHAHHSLALGCGRFRQRRR